MADNVMTTVLQLKTVMDISDVRSNAKAIQNSLSKLKLPDNMSKSLDSSFDKLEGKIDKYQSKLAAGIKTTGDVTSLEKLGNEINNLFASISTEINKIKNEDLEKAFTIDETPLRELEKELIQVDSVVKGKLKKDLSGLSETINNELRSIAGDKSALGREGGLLDKLIGSFDSGDVKEIEAALTQLEHHLKRFGKEGVDKVTGESGNLLYGSIKFDKFAKEARKAYNDAKAGASDYLTEQKRLETEVANFKVNAISRAVEAYHQNAIAIEGANRQARDYLNTQNDIAAAEQSISQQAKNLESQINSYFGIDQVLRKVIDLGRQAFQTVKDLDAAMTETAVVTDFSVGDMWDMLPTYTEQANQLGSTIQDVYESATLYYQQGLNTTQSMALATETLKMARIAGIEAAEATDMMTAALRGFNMQINEVSAQRINDVYSKLAAITASDTQEIGSAMERTASIANSANMEFETTSAFLAQMIETTREAPENLGTAMKTIVARFQEMKKDPTKLIDSEGVAMDANKVDTALKTIGVSLMNTKGEFRDLDDVFLEISSKWDSLTQGQQRYIATIAAGSRQQSRFIAMMSDYDRTMELIEAANNSAGASQLQFEKTLESLDSKINTLKNAWNQYIMGLMNNDIIKFGVDAITKFFTIVNKVTDLLTGKLPDPFGGITKSAITLVGTMGGLLTTGKLVRKLLRGFSAATNPDGNGLIDAFPKLKDKQTSKAAEVSGRQAAEAWKRGFRANMADGKDVKNAINNIFSQIHSKEITLQDFFNRAGDNKGVINAVMPAVTRQIRGSLDSGGLLEKLGREKANEFLSAFQEDILSKGSTVAFENFENRLRSALGKDYPKGIPSFQNVKIGTEELNKSASNIAGLQKFASGLGSIGYALTDVGQKLQGTPLAPFGNALTMVGSILTTFSSALNAATAAEGAFAAKSATLEVILTPKILLPIIAAIAGFIALLAILDKAIESDAERLEKTKKAAMSAAQGYDTAKQTLSELKDEISTIRDNEDAFDGLVEGTLEWKQAMIEANGAILQLLSTYPMLYDFLTIDPNGLMHLSDEGLDKLLEQQQQNALNAAALNSAQSGRYNAELKTEGIKAAEKEIKSLQNQISYYEKNINYVGENTAAKQISSLQEQLAIEEQKLNLLKKEAEVAKEVGYSTSLQSSLSNDLFDKDVIIDYYAKNFESLFLDKVDLGDISNSDMANAYAAYNGWTYDKDEKAFYDANHKEVESYNKETVKEQYKVIKANEMASESAIAFSKGLVSAEEIFREAGFTGLNSNFSDLLKGNANFNFDILANGKGFSKILNKALGKLSSKDIENITAGMGIANNKDALFDELVNLRDEIIKANLENRATLVNSLSENGKYDPAAINSYSQEQINSLANTYHSLLESASYGIADSFVEETHRALQGLKTAGQDELFDLINSATWGSAIGRLEAFKEAANSNNKEIQEWGASLKELETNIESKAVLEVWDDNNFQEAIKDLEKLKNAAGEIDASAVKDLSKESAVLKKYMDATNTSASQFASIMNALTGDLNINIQTLTDRVLGLIKSLNSVQGAFDDNAAYIANYDAGSDTQEAEKFLTDQYDAIKKLIKPSSGPTQLGNNLIDTYIKNSLNEKEYAEYLKAYNEDPGKAKVKYANYIGNYRDAGTGFRYILNHKDIQKALEAEGVTVANKGGKIAIDFGGKDIEGFSEALSKATGLSSEWASLLAQSYVNYSPDAEKELKENAQANAIKEYGQELKESGKVTTDEELENAAKVLGYTVDEFKGELKKQGVKNITTFATTDESGTLLDGKEIYNNMQDAGVKVEKIFGEDIQKSMQELTKVGVIEQSAQVGAIMADAIKNSTPDKEGNYTLQYGDLGEVKFSAGTTEQEFLAKLQELQENPEQTEALKAIGQDVSAIAKKYTGNDDEIKPDEPIELPSTMGGTAEEYKAEQHRKRAESNETRWSNSRVDEEGEDDRSWFKEWWQNLRKKTRNLPIYEVPSETSPEERDIVKDFKASEGQKEEFTNAGVEAAKGFVEDLFLSLSDSIQKQNPEIDPTVIQPLIQDLITKAKEAIDSANTTPVVPSLYSSNTNNKQKSEKFSFDMTGDGNIINRSLALTNSINNIPTEKNVSINSNIDDVINQTNQLTSNLKQSNKLSVQDEATSVIQDAIDVANKFNGLKPKPTIDINDLASSKIQKIIDTTIPEKTVKVKFEASGNKTAEKAFLTNNDYKGRNYAQSYSKLNSFAQGKGQFINSFAHGKTSGSGGLSLTGELGYEIAWLPKEQRAMIVGAQGPQLVDLPNDAVVYPHELSEEIVKQKSIPLNSFATSSLSVSSSTSTTKKTTTKSTASEEEKQIARTVGKISAKLINIDSRLSTYNRQIDESSDKIADALADVGNFVYSNIANEIKNQVDRLNKVIKENVNRRNIYKSILNDLVTKDEKGKNPYTGIDYDNFEISYSVGEENVTKPVNLASYVKELADGRYGIDEAALQAVANDSSRGFEEAMAIKDALENELKNLYSEIDSADDNIKNAQKQLKDLTKQLQDTLFGWENELTKIAKLQNNLSMKESYKSILDSESELVLARLGAGFTSLAAAGKQYSTAMKNALDATTSSIKLQAKIVKESINQYNQDLSVKDERDAFTSARKKFSKMDSSDPEYLLQKARVQQLREEYARERMARRYVSTSIDKNGQRQVNIDVGAVEAARRAGNMTADEYQAVKDYYDRLVDEVNSINEGVANIKSSIAELYTQYLDQYSMMSDYTQKIASGMEERDQETVDKLEQLNNNLQEAFSNLIDKVKESIDAQRQAEENQKTEQDITDQMNRLAILRANTSGGNASEIAQLEKSIREATGNYEDSLEDQMLERMEKQADAASKQREQQIKIMTNQLNQSKTLGVYVARAERMVQRIADGNATKAMLHEALSYYLGTEPIDKWGRQYQTGQFNQDTARVQNFNSTITQLRDRIKSLEETLKETNKELKKGKNTKSLSSGLGINDVKAEGMSAAWALRQGYSGREVAKAYGLNAGQLQKMINKHKSDKDVSQADLAGMTTSFKNAGANTPKKGIVGKNGLTVAANQGSVLYLQGIDKKTGQGNGTFTKYTTAQLTPALIKNNQKEAGEAIIEAFKKKGPGEVINRQWAELLKASTYSKLKAGSKIQFKGGKGTISDDGFIKYKDASGVVRYWDPASGHVLSTNEWRRIKKKNNLAENSIDSNLPIYARGGLSTKTGPAWLDGTKSKPELILNATDTKNFLALRAALEDSGGSLGSVIESNTEYTTNYEININVESIANDYDVDQMVERVRRSILKESRGTNVTSVIRRK